MASGGFISARTRRIGSELPTSLVPRGRPTVAVGMARARARNGADGPDRFESERVDFFERVRQAYLQRAAQAPDRFRVVDASDELDAVESAIRAALQPLLATQARPR